MDGCGILVALSVRGWKECRETHPVEGWDGEKSQGERSQGEREGGGK